MRVLEGSLATDEFDLVERKIFQDAPAFHVHDFALVVHEIVDGEIFLQRIVDAIEAALLESGKIEGGFAEGLAGNGAGVDATSAHVLGAFDDNDALAEVGGLGAALLTSRAAPDDDEIESVARSHEFLREVAGPRSPIRKTPGARTILEQDGRQVRSIEQRVPKWEELVDLPCFRMSGPPRRTANTGLRGK